MKTIRTLGGASVAALGLIGILASGGGGGGGDDLAEPIGDISGTWTVSEVVTAASGVCAESVGATDTYQVTVTQDGNDLTVATPDGTFSGTLDGNAFEWTGSFPDDGGVLDINSMDVTVAADCNSMSGTVNWSWSGGGESCSGTASVNGARDDAVGCTGSGGGVTPISEIEPNDDPLSEAQSIASLPVIINGTTSGSTEIDPATADLDWFSYSPGSTGSVTITVTGYGDNDIDLTIFDSTEVQVGFSWENDPSESTTVSMQAGETYYIIVEPWAVTGTTNYSLTLQ